MKPTHLTLAAAIGIVGIGAFVGGRISAPNASSDPDALPATGLSTKSARAGSPGFAAADPTRDHSQKRTSPAHPDESELGSRMRSALGLVDPVDRTRSWIEFLDRLSTDDFLSVIESFREGGVPENRMGEYAMLLSAWAKRDPLAALDYASQNTGSPFARQTVLASWATYDPDAALRWAEANHDGEGANPWIVGVIRGIAASDPERATELMSSMPFSRERADALSAILPTILADGPEAARNWIGAISDERLRNGAMERVAERLANVDPRGTADWLLANPGDATNRRMDDVLSVWTKSDETGAVSYFRELPAGEARTNALRGIVSSFARDDPQRAADFLDSHSDDANDRVFQQFVWQSFRNEPALAADYIGRIANEGSRDSMYRRTLESWLHRDEASAMSWIGSNTLPESVAKDLARRIQERQQQQQ